MSLLLILRKIWKYKLITLPIFAFVLVGSYYVIAVTEPTYEASATYILVNPNPPSASEIERDPSVERLYTDNPYLSFDGSVLVQVLASRLTSEEVRAGLAKQGADPNYTAAPSAEFGFSAPILQITGTGTSADAAVNTTNLVGRALSEELARMQDIREVDKDYRIKGEAVVAAHGAKLKASGKLRSLVAVFVLGAIMLFIAISVLDALAALRTEWAQGRVDGDQFPPGGSVEPLRPVDPDPLLYSDSDQDPRPWPRKAQQ